MDDADELVIVESWASDELYERWSTGPVASGWLRQIEGLLTKPPAGRVYRIVEAVG